MAAASAWETGATATGTPIVAASTVGAVAVGTSTAGTAGRAIGEVVASGETVPIASDADPSGGTIEVLEFMSAVSGG